MTLPKFRLNAVRSEITLSLHPYTGHVVIKTQDWDDEYNNFFETTEHEFNQASIMLDKKRVQALIEELNKLLKTMNE